MNIPIVFACDNNYALPTAVAITSMIANKEAGTCYDIWILTNALSDVHAQRLASLACPGVTVTIKAVPDRHCDIPGHGHVTTTALYRLALPELFPEHDAVLYLDGDIVVLSDLTPLLAIDLGRHYAAAVQQIVILDLPPYPFHAHGKAFFSGVLLLNLRRMREENMYPRLIESVIRNNIGANDQLALNQNFKQDIVWMDLAYNFCNSYDMLCTDREAARHFGITPGEWRRVRKNPVILHYIDAKPWLVRHCLRSNVWRRYYRQSPYRDVAPPYRPSPKAFFIWLLDIFLPGFLRPFLRRLYVRFVR